MKCRGNTTHNTGIVDLTKALLILLGARLRVAVTIKIMTIMITMVVGEFQCVSVGILSPTF